MSVSQPVPNAGDGFSEAGWEEWVTTDRSVLEAYETDSSGLHLVPDAVARPATESEIAEILRQATATRTCVTPAGGQTSTTAASITDRGILLSLRAMNGVRDVDHRRKTVRAAAGAILGDVKRAAASEGFLLAPDPTSENECTIGGAIACNASGARTLKYGAMRRHVRALRVALADGSIVDLRRTDLEKNTVGYAFAHEPIDWFIGSEGTLGVVLEAELALLPLPAAVTGLAIPFPNEHAALAFVVQARESDTLSPRCLEYFDANALLIAKSVDDQPGWADGAGGMVYLEQEASDSSDTGIEGWAELADLAGALGDIRVFDGDAAIRHARRMRHAVPSTMNERGSVYRIAGGRRVSTDWAVPYREIANALAESRAIADRYGVPQAIAFGHAGNGHPHQNYIARDAEELERIEQVVEETLRYALSIGGTVAAEHGIGKVKRRWLPLQMTPLQSAVMRAVKSELDPHGLLAPGNIL